MSISKYITRRDPQKIGEMRDMGINLNDFAPAREPSNRDSLLSGIAKAVRTNIPVQQTPFIGRDFSQFDLAKMGQLPIAPGYNEEMDIDDTGRITLRNYLQEFGDTAKSGLENLADRGMSLFDDSQRSNLTRAGLGALLFGFNPITALLGAFAGSKAPDMISAFKENRFNPMEYIREKRAERLAQIDREEKARLASRIRSGGGTIDSGNEGGYGGTGGEGPSAVGSSGMLGGGV